MEAPRTSANQRNPALEDLLRETNALLADAQAKLNAKYLQPRMPPLFLMGCARSGTTLFMQWLAATGSFAYPTNLLSRFYAAPAIGARIQLLLTDPRFNFKGELSDIAVAPTFTSDLGKTKGALAPNEFWYFWRRFIPNEEPRALSPEEAARIDGKGFAVEIAALEDVFQKPFALKGLILTYNLDAIDSIFDKALFVSIKRHPFHNIQSLLESREKFFGTREQWYSVKPPEYEALKELDPIRQVAGQVYYTNRSVEKQLALVGAERALPIRYEDFCSNPKAVYETIVQKYREQGVELTESYAGPHQFKVGNEIRLPDQDVEAIVRAWKEFSGEEICL